MSIDGSKLNLFQPHKRTFQVLLLTDTKCILRMDNIIQSDELWKYASDQVAVDFLELIQLTTRRCRKLNEETRLKFYFQQLEIIENFRLRMNQIFDDTQSHEKYER